MNLLLKILIQILKFKSNKEGEDIYVSGLSQFNSSYPLIKNDLYQSLFKPKYLQKLTQVIPKI